MNSRKISDILADILAITFVWFKILICIVLIVLILRVAGQIGNTVQELRDYLNIYGGKFKSVEPDSAFFFDVWHSVKARHFYSQPITEDSASIIWQEVKKSLKNNPGKNDSIVFAGLTRLSQTTPDGHTYFFNPEEAKEHKKRRAGDMEFSGIGIHITKHQEKIKILKTMPNSPAEKAGLRRGDIIEKADDQIITSLGEAVNSIRGKINTSVTLTIQRADSILEIKVIRNRINPPRVEWRIIDQDIYYVKLRNFSQGSANDFSRVLDSLGIERNWIPHQLVDNSKKKIFIFDLRGNPGGLVDEVQKIIGFWTSQISYFRAGKNKTLSYKCWQLVNPLANFKTIILTDRGTASASEINTGALLSYGLATTVGDTTYGKGCGQHIYDLPFETALKITTFIWLTPDKECIDGIGFPPQFFVEFDLDLWFKKEIDNQLEAAINIAKIK